MQLKDFQERALKVFGDFLAEVRISGDLEGVFGKLAPKLRGEPAPYRRAPGLEDVPYLCLRLPTGGGKTIVGAHAIHVAAANYIERDFPVVLWMVPSDTIRVQTAVALKDTRHPYRIALDQVFDGRVRVFDADEIDNIRPADLQQNVCILVATIQTFNVQNTKLRNVYADKESLQDFFRSVPDNIAGLEQTEQGRMRYSFANLMKLQRPMIIVDEAHNVRTKQAFETLSRLGPSCILELTATPKLTGDTPSNVLCVVSAGELKAAEMIKLPILLTEHAEGWKQTVSAALRERAGLAELAGGETDFVRPLLLIQAENADKEANVTVVKQYLLDEGVATERIRIATGDQRELDGVNLFDPACKVDVIVTVKALKEGWDCSFAYVFCSVANIGSTTDVEQLLGRVLRMPYARARQVPELNQAYAHVASEKFGEAARRLRDNLVQNMGFTPDEAAGAVVVRQATSETPSLFAHVIELSASPKFTGVPSDETQAVRVKRSEDGAWSVELRDLVTPGVRARVLAVVPPEAHQEAEKKIERHNIEVLARVPTEAQKVNFLVPRLWVTVDGQMQLFSDLIVDDEMPWTLEGVPFELDTFHYDPQTQRFAIDFEAGQLEVKPLSGQAGLDLLIKPWNEVDLVRWLDGELKDPNVSQAVRETWILSAVRSLTVTKKTDIGQLVRGKFALARRLKEILTKAKDAAKRSVYQMLLSKAVVPQGDEFEFRFDPRRYSPATRYVGYMTFRNHLCPNVVGDMNEAEVACAVVLDSHDKVVSWVRNISGNERDSFWLQTATDKFYPDFVALLNDGRVLLLEYKGQLEVKEDSDEKQQLGELWEGRSGGRGLFLMARGQDIAVQIKAKIGG